MAVFPAAIATGDIVKYQSFVYGSFVWEIHLRYNNIYIQSNLDYSKCQGPHESFRIIGSSNQNREFSGIFRKSSDAFIECHYFARVCSLNS